MAVLVALLLLLSPGSACTETLHLGVSAAPEAASMLPGMPGLQSGIQRLFSAELGVFASLAFDEGQPRPDGEPSARLLLAASGNALSVSTDFTRAGATRSLVSTVPSGSPSSLLATIVGDLSFLYFSSRGFSTIPLSPPPALVAVLSTDTLAAFTAWNSDELEPVGLAASGGEVTICFPHRYLTLGPLFQISPSTIRDINAQAVGGEPLQLSGVIKGPGDELLLLSERSAQIALVDPRLGTRSLVEVPGLSALPGRLIGTRTVAALPGKLGEPGVRLFPLGGGRPRTVGAAASYVPAFDVDREGNLWTWDAGERRIRIVTPRGREVFAIRPLFGASAMPLPQQLAVFDDGSFLLAGSGEVWKFQGSGVPVWRLARIPGRTPESLPSSFDLAVNRADGSLTLLDAQSRRLLSFSASPAGAAAHLGTLLGRLDSRKRADLQELSAFARAGGLGLMALQFGDLLVRAGGSEADRESARAALLREKAAAYADLADGLTRDLLYARADGAWLRSAETLRELSAESPEDDSAAGMLQTVIARRKEVREALSGANEIQAVSSRVLVERTGACATTLTLEVTLRNAGTRAVQGLRMHAGLPPIVQTPALEVIDEILPSKERLVRIALGVPTGAAAPGGTVMVSVLVTYERGQEGFSQALSFSATVVPVGPPGSPAEDLACRAVPQDTLAASLPDSLAGTARPPQEEPLIELAGVLDALGAARSASAGASSPEMPPLPGETPSPSMRNLLRTLSGEESEWTVVTASIAASLGMQSAVVTVGKRPFAVVDTGIPFFDAMASIAGLARFKVALAALSPAGTLWIPFSGRVPPADAGAAAWAAVDALAALEAADVTGTPRFAVPASATQQNAPNPFPLVLPVVTAWPSMQSLRNEMVSALAAVPR